MTTIDAAIIKALVEHVGGDSSGIPDGTIGGVSYTAGDGINITNNNISVEYDSSTMELKDGKISAKTQLAAGNGISISSGKVNVNYDETTLKITDGKLGVNVSESGTILTKLTDITYSVVSGKLVISNAKYVRTGDILRFGYKNPISQETVPVDWVIVKKSYKSSDSTGTLIARGQLTSTGTPLTYEFTIARDASSNEINATSTSSLNSSIKTDADFGGVYRSSVLDARLQSYVYDMILSVDSC